MSRCGPRWGRSPRGTGGRRRLIAVLAVAGLSGFLAACGDDEADRPVAAKAGAPMLSLSEVRSVLDTTGQLAVVQSGGGGDPQLPDGTPPLADSARLESQSGREFDLLVFRSALEAKRAVPSVVALQAGASGSRAANVVAVFPERFSEVAAFRAAASGMRRLRVACTPGGAGEPDLRELCFGGPDGVSPTGEGVDRDDAQSEERPIVVAGLRYDVLSARRLNPNIRPASGFLSGRKPPAGKVWFGVFLRVCNESGQTRTPSSRLALVDAFGERLEPSEALPSSNPFVYDARPLAADACLPAEGSTAERAVDGALVLFAVAPDILRNRPLALEVTGPDGVRKRVIVDL